jgi:Flp pilus assembly pilin Flp
MKEIMLRGYVFADIRLHLLCERFKRDVRGAGTAEYAMIIGIAVVLGVVILQRFWGTSGDGTNPGTGLAGVFDRIMQALNGATGG